MKAYHFLRADMTAASGNEPPWTVGETRHAKGKIILCRSGFHSSPTPSAALEYATVPMLCLVDISKPREKDATKQVSSRRTLIKSVNVERELHELACRIAEDVLPLFEAMYPNDKRPRQAIEAKRQWLRGAITRQQMAAARAAAGAAWAAARDAARDAAWAAAGDTWDAARDAAWAAAGAAGAAAGDAAWDAAGAAAGDAARQKYRNWIDETLISALEAAGA